MRLAFRFPELAVKPENSFHFDFSGVKRDSAE